MEEVNRHVTFGNEPKQADICKKEGGEIRDGRAVSMDEVDPTVAYNMETDNASEGEEEGKGRSQRGGVLDATEHISGRPSDSDQTDLEGEGELDVTSTGQQEEGKKEVMTVDATLAYPVSEGKVWLQMCARKCVVIITIETF